MTPNNMNVPAPNVPYFTPAQMVPSSTALDHQPNGNAIPKLFQPLKIRGLELQNRIMLSPLCQYSTRDGSPQPLHIAHLGGIITRGPGLSFFEATAVEPQGRSTPEDLGLWSDDQVALLAKIFASAHSQGQKMGIRLAYAGRKASGMAPWVKGDIVSSEEAGGWPNDIWGPSPISFYEGLPPPKEMTSERIKAVVKAFVAAAVRSVQAGIDVIEINSSHGHLLYSFLSPVSNKRTDEYGGSFENRIRFTLEIANAVRAVIPTDMPLFLRHVVLLLTLRISATDWLEDVLPKEESWCSRSEDTCRLAPILFEHDAVAAYFKELGVALHTKPHLPFAEDIKRSLPAGHGLLVGTVLSVPCVQIHYSLVVLTSLKRPALVAMALLQTPLLDLKARPPRPSLHVNCMPLEILGLIQSHVDPIDILSLRQTSKYINSSTKDRSVWIEVLRNVCCTHGVFEPSFDLKKMTQAEIEHAALCPFRFGYLLTKRRPSYIKPRATRLLNNDDETVVDMHLIPGGRFLLTQTDDSNIHLWDLGYSPASVIKYLPIASLKPQLAVQPGQSREINSIQPTKVGFSFFLILLDNTPGTFDVRDQNLTTMLVSSNLCIFYSGCDLTIWDYTADLAVTWKTFWDILDITISSGCLLVFGERGFDTWEPFELIKHASKDGTCHQLIETASPVFNFSYARHAVDGDAYNDGDVVVPHSAWPRGSGRAHIVSIFLHSEDGPGLHYYNVEQLYASDGPVVVPRLKASVDLDETAFEFRIPQEHGRFAGRWYVQPYHRKDDGWVFVNVANPTNLCKNSTVKLSNEVELFALCPMSGRMCTMDSDGEHIWVQDFVVPN
ncbi:hypothetical protein DXG01_006362 [Tephrocybe rancida]|nr:hypothetical protein DXG01_006362 [Tephrocybe rancida]